MSQVQVAKAAQLYAALASNYDAETRYIKGIRELAIAALRLQPGEVVLDAGCGTGWCLPPLSHAVGAQGRVMAFEPSVDMLELARQRVQESGISNVALIHACGATATLSAQPDAVLFSYTHDLLRSHESLENLFGQCRSGTRIVAASTKLFPRWFFPGNWYLRHTHRMTITNFEGFDKPWSRLPDYCDTWSVRTTMPGSRYVFTGVLR